MIRTLMALLLLITSPALAKPIAPSQIVVTDGDTIRVGVRSYRLIGLDTPETSRALCASERAKGYAATAALRRLIYSGQALSLIEVPCSCAPGTLNTPSCNRGQTVWRADSERRRRCHHHDQSRACATLSLQRVTLPEAGRMVLNAAPGLPGNLGRADGSPRIL